MMLEACGAEEVQDIKWLHQMERGLAIASEARKPVVLKPLGQGLDDFDGW
jgi:hypothetical protein